MGIFRHQRFMIFICLLSICLLPVVSACVTAVQTPDMEIEKIVITDKNGAAVSGLNEIGEYTIAVDQGEGTLRLYYRCNDQLIQLQGEWNEEQKQWYVHTEFNETGIYQIVAEWIQDEEITDKWESEVYQIVDLDHLLTKEVTANTSLLLKLQQCDGIKITAKLQDKAQNEVITVSESELSNGFCFEQEGIWDLIVEAENSSGYVLSKTYHEILVIDHTKPVLSIKSGAHDLIKESLPLQDQPVVLSLSVEDRHLDASSLAVIVNDKAQKVEWQQKNDAYTAVLELNKDGAYIIQLSAKDSFDNQTIVHSTQFIIDQSNPQIQILLDDHEVDQLPEYINHKAELKCIVYDMNFDAENSILTDGDIAYNSWQQNDNSWMIELVLKDGEHQLNVDAKDLLKHTESRRLYTIIDSIRPLVSMTYEALDNYQKDVTVSFLIQDANFKTDSSMIYFTQNEQRIQPDIKWHTVEDGIEASFVTTKEGIYELSLQLCDSAGNSAVYRYNGKQSDDFKHVFLLDKTAPLVRMDFTQAKMSARNQQMNIQIKDDFIDVRNIQLEIKKDHKQYDAKKDWQISEAGISANCEFTEEGFYEVSVSAIDRAGNQSRQLLDYFTIDKKPPVISIARDREKLYFNQPLALQVAVDDAYLAGYDISVYRDQKQIRTDHGDAAAKNSLRIEQDGDYEIVVSGYDEAGNQTELRDHFILDQSAPKLTASFDEMPAQNHQRFITNRSVSLKMTWEDRYLKNEMIRITKNGKEVPLSFHDHAFAYELKAAEDHEDLYEIVVSFTDEAGNRTDAAYELMIDTYLPELRFLDDPFQGKAKNIAWTPHLEQENEAFQISDVILYRNRQMLPAYRWGDAISKDGHYILSVQIRDDAMNERALLPPFSFTIDTQPPVIEIVEEERREALLDQNVSLDTNLRLYISDALCDNVNIHMLMLGEDDLLKRERRQDENGLWFYPISFRKEGDVTLFIDVSDEADNHTKQLLTYHVLPHLKKEQVKTIENKTPLMVHENSADHRAAWILGAMASVLLILIVRKLYAEKQ